MAKHAKTRKQKKLADLRRKTDFHTPHFNNSEKTEREVKTASPEQIVSPKRISTPTVDYQYLQTDLMKTIFLTVSIAATQLVIYFFIFKI